MREETMLTIAGKIGCHDVQYTMKFPGIWCAGHISQQKHLASHKLQDISKYHPNFESGFPVRWWTLEIQPKVLMQHSSQSCRLVSLCRWGSLWKVFCTLVSSPHKNASAQKVAMTRHPWTRRHCPALRHWMVCCPRFKSFLVKTMSLAWCL